MNTFEQVQEQLNNLKKFNSTITFDILVAK